MTHAMSGVNLKLYADFNQNLQSTKMKVVAKMEFKNLARAIFDSFGISEGICINISIIPIA